jgi:hypothetical protein
MTRIARLAARLTVAAAPFAATAVALAQAQGKGPRNPKLDTVASPVVGYGIVVILAVIVLSISLYPSKRAHTDL